MKGGTYMAEEQTVLFGHSINKLDQAIQDLRRVAHHLLPAILVKLGLIPALKNFCQNLNDSGLIQVHLQHFNFPQRLNLEQETITYRMIQEAVNNALKHAEAKQIIIQLRRVENQIQIEVEDDGKGFDPTRIPYTKAGGLQNLKNRAEYLKGSLSIDSEPDKGTTIHIEFPLG